MRVNILAVFGIEDWSRRRKRLAIGGLATVVVVAVTAIVLGPIVRSRVEKEATRRGLAVGVGHVRVGWFGVKLSDVAVVPEGTKGIHAHVDTVRVGLGLALGVDRLALEGVHADLEDDAVAEITAWRERHVAKGPTPASKAPIVVEGGSVSWKRLLGDADASLEASGISVRRDDSGLQVSAESVIVTRRRTSVSLGGE